MVRLGSDASTQQLYLKMRGLISGWVGGSHHCKVVWLTNMPTLQSQILVLPTRPVYVGQVQSDTAWSAWPSSRDADNVGDAGAVALAEALKAMAVTCSHELREHTCVCF